MLSAGMSPAQWTGKTSPDLPARGPVLVWEQEAAGSNPAIPTGVMSQDIGMTPNPRYGSGCWAWLRAGRVRSAGPRAARPRLEGTFMGGGGTLPSVA